MPRSTWMYESGVGQGRPYAATKLLVAILDNAAGVGPEGRGQNARVHYMDVRERRLNDLGLLSANARKADTRAATPGSPHRSMRRWYLS